MARIKKGDTVTIQWGRNKGKSGKVLRVWPKTNAALVERVNVVKHFETKSQQNPSGGIVDREAPLPMSMLLLTCPRCNKPSRAKISLATDGSKQRVCKSCNSSL